MDPDPSSSLQPFFPVACLIVLNGLFVAAEYALISCDPSRIREDAENKSEGKCSTLWLIENSELCVASIQLAITTCSMMVGWFGIKYFVPRIEPILISSQEAGLIPSGDMGVVTFCLTLIILIFIHVIFGELVVKAVATSFPEKTLSILSRLVKLFTQLTYPISRLSYVLANLLLKPFRLTVGQSDKDLLSIKELKRLFSSVPSSSELGSEQARMIRGVVGFSETVAREVMTPRTDLVTIKVNSNLSEVVKVVVDSGFSRLPVRGDRVDDVLGVLLARDVIPYLTDNTDLLSKEFDVRRIMRQAYFIPGTKPIDDLLNEFRRRKLHMAVILDEHGGVDGVVTMEDLIEEIVGDIFDEGDELEKDISTSEDGLLVVDGGVLVSDLNDRFSLSIPEGEYDTIAGFIFTCLGRMPKKGDEIYVDFEATANVFINGELIPLKSSIDDEESKESPDQIVEGARISVQKVQGHRIETITLDIISSKSDSSLESELDAPASEEKQVIGNK